MDDIQQKNNLGEGNSSDMSDPISEVSLSDLEKFLKTYELRHLKSTIFERFAILIISASGFIAALAWDDALKAFFREFVGFSTNASSKFIYALIITTLAIILSIILGKKTIRKRKKNLE